MTNEEVKREYLSRRSGPLYHLTSGPQAVGDFRNTVDLNLKFFFKLEKF